VTDREREVLEQLAEGKSSHEAAQALYVSDQAITYHVGNLLAKFQCTNRTALVAQAFVLGILSLTWPPHVIGRPRGSGGARKQSICPHGVKELTRRRTSVWS
jgi:DNA-binding CsgD family transcriptional regulator